MLLRRFCVPATLICALALAAVSSSFGNPPSDRFPDIANERIPDAITGAWEQHLVSGETLGLSIALITTVGGTATTLRGVKQYVRLVYIVSYLRSGSHTKRVFWQSDMPGHLYWHHNHLRLKVLTKRLFFRATST